MRGEGLNIGLLFCTFHVTVMQLILQILNFLHELVRVLKLMLLALLLKLNLLIIDLLIQIMQVCVFHLKSLCLSLAILELLLQNLVP